MRDGFYCVSDVVHNVLMCNIMNQAQHSYQHAILSDTTPYFKYFLWLSLLMDLIIQYFLETSTKWLLMLVLWS